MIKKKDVELLAQLRSAGRKKVTEISRELGIPPTTLYDRLSVLESSVGLRHTALVDFNRLGYLRTVHMGFKVGTDDRDAFESHIAKHPALNSLYRVNHGFDFLAHLVFRDANDMKEFLETVQRGFDIREVQIFEVIDEVAKERFLTRN
jgi:DNA-binding Lrp family transcriptional regulator